MSLRQRLVPYWLLGPGLLWLIVFFVVPMYFMGELALRYEKLTISGTNMTHGVSLAWEWTWSSFGLPVNVMNHMRNM